MSDRRLSTLITASGGTPGAGQTFGDDVTASEPNVAMSYYILEDWVSWNNPTGYPGILPNGTELEFTWTFSSNSHWGNIRFEPMASGITVADTGADPALADITYAAYDDPINYTGKLRVELSGKAGDSGYYDDITFGISLAGDAGGFNDSLYHEFTVRMQRRGGTGGGGGGGPYEKPYNLDATGGEAQCSVTWTNTSPYIWAIRLRLDYWNGSAWELNHQVVDRVAGQSSYTFSGIATAGDYRVRGTYFNLGGESSAGYNTSDTAAVTVSGGSAPTETPENCALYASGGNAVNAAWNNTNSWDTIEVVYYRNSEYFSSHQIAANNTTDSESGFGASAEVTCDVRYYNGYGSGPVSNTGGPAYP